MADMAMDPSADFDAKRLAMKQRAIQQGAQSDAMGSITQPATPDGSDTPSLTAPAQPRTAIDVSPRDPSQPISPIMNPTAQTNPTYAASLGPAPAQPPAPTQAGPVMDQPPAQGMQSRLPQGVSAHANIPGVFEAKGPDGSITYTDNPFGKFDAKGRYNLPTDMGNGTMPKDTASAAGIPQMLPTGQPNPAWFAKNSEIPSDGTDEQKGMQLSANKAANVAFRTNSGPYAPRNALTDVDAIGSGAAYNHRAADGTMVSGAPQGPQAGANPIELMKTLAQTEEQRSLAQNRQAQFNLDARGVVNKGGEDSYNSHLKAMEDDKSMGDEDKRNLAAINVAREEIAQGKSPDQMSERGRNGARAFLDEAGKSTAPMMGRGNAAGETQPGDVKIEQSPFWKVGSKTQLSVNGPDGTPNTTAYNRNMSPVMQRMLGSSGTAQDVNPFIQHFQKYGDYYGINRGMKQPGQ